MLKEHKIVMLQSDKKANIGENIIIKYHKGLTPNKLECGVKKFNNDSIATEQNLYLVSDEEIKVGDWYLVTHQNRIVKHDLSSSFVGTTEKKIIASTDINLSLPTFSQSFIKKYCELDSISEVMVEYITNDELIESFQERIDEDESQGIIPSSWQNDFDHLCYRDDFYILKLRDDNTIITKKIKDSWSRKEVIELTIKAFQAGINKTNDSTQPDFLNWATSQNL